MVEVSSGLVVQNIGGGSYLLDDIVVFASYSLAYLYIFYIGYSIRTHITSIRHSTYEYMNRLLSQ